MAEADVAATFAAAAQTSASRNRKKKGKSSGGGGGLEIQLSPIDGASSSSSSFSAAADHTVAAGSLAPPSSSSSSSSGKTGPQGHWGFTASGDRFDVPDTLNTTEIFLPRNLSIGSAISGALFLTAAYITVFCNYSVWVNVAIFFWWRLWYDLGLGLILRAQSERKSFLKFYEKQYKQGGWKARLMDHLARMQLSRSVRQAKPIQSHPQEFRGWLVYKNLVNIILVNDGLTYLLLFYKCFRLPSEWGLLVVAQYALGVFLGVFNYWAKVDAHRCIGEYCWYWGDFFFRKDLSLTFDGIFELFPHPMYTVGYALYYGASLISRSYTLLFVSLLAHGCQLAFLFFVEEPHIKRTYGSGETLDRTKMKVLYDPKSGWFPDKKDNVFLLDVDLFRSGDIAVVLFSAYAVLLAFLPSTPGWSLAQIAFWRAFHWVGLGTILWAQSKWGTWNNHFTTRGRTIYEAFGHWKNTYNMSLTLNLVSFIAATIRYTAIDWENSNLISPRWIACFAVGCVLIALSIWSFLSTWEAVGEFGWFYGDFFVPPDAFRTQLCYTGIYRFLNNPDAVTGYAGQYGAAIISGRWEIFIVAVCSHVMNMIFLQVVEAPHMSRLYSSKEVRLESPFPKALKKMRQELSDLPDQVRQNIREKTDRGTGEARRVLRKLKQVAKEVTSPRPGGLLSRSSSYESISSPEGPRPPSTSPPESSTEDVDTE